MTIITMIIEYWLMLHDTAIRWMAECPVAYMVHSITSMAAGYMLYAIIDYVRNEIDIRKTLKELEK